MLGVFLTFVLLGVLIGYLLVIKPRRDAERAGGGRPPRPGRGPRTPRRPGAASVKGPDDDEEFQALLRRRVAEQRRRQQGPEGESSAA